MDIEIKTSQNWAKDVNTKTPSRLSLTGGQYCPNKYWFRGLILSKQWGRIGDQMGGRKYFVVISYNINWKTSRAVLVSNSKSS